MNHLLILLSLFFTTAFLGAGLVNHCFATGVTNLSLHRNWAMFCLICCLALTEQFLYPNTAAALSLTPLLTFLGGAGIRICNMSQAENQRLMAFFSRVERCAFDQNH